MTLDLTAAVGNLHRSVNGMRPSNFRYLILSPQAADIRHSQLPACLLMP